MYCCSWRKATSDRFARRCSSLTVNWDAIVSKKDSNLPSRELDSCLAFFAARSSSITILPSAILILTAVFLLALFFVPLIISSVVLSSFSFSSLTTFFSHPLLPLLRSSHRQVSSPTGTSLKDHPPCQIDCLFRYPELQSS